MSEEQDTYQQEQAEYERILSELPELVKNRFDNYTVEGEYPVIYGRYHYDNEYQDRRIKYYKEFSQNPLTELKEKQRVITAQIDKKEQKIYSLAAKAIQLANKYLSESKASALKDEVILWLLAACREGEGYPGTGNGFCGLWDISLSALGIEPESSLLENKVYQLNRHRAKEWFILKVKEQVISDCYKKIALDDPNFKSYWNDSTARTGNDEDVDYSKALNLFKEIVNELNKGIDSGNISRDKDVIKIFRRYKSDFEKREGDKKYIKRYSQYDEKNKIGISRALKRIFDHKFNQAGNAESIKVFCTRNDVWDS